MSLLMMLFAAAAVAVGLIETISHVGGSSYVFGNAKIFGIALEGMVFWTTLMTAGTVSGLIINTIAGLMIYGLLSAGAAWHGGKKIGWSWAKRSNGRLGFSVTVLEPTMTIEKFGQSLKGLFGKITSVFTRLFSSVTEADTSINSTALAV